MIIDSSLLFTNWYWSTIHLNFFFNKIQFVILFSCFLQIMLLTLFSSFFSLQNLFLILLPVYRIILLVLNSYMIICIQMKCKKERSFFIWLKKFWPYHISPHYVCLNYYVNQLCTCNITAIYIIYNMLFDVVITWDHRRPSR